MDLILASTSRYRRALLGRLGIPFRAVAPEVDEAGEPYRGLSARQRAEALAEAKARAVASRFPASTVIGSDQVVSLDTRILGKPGSAQAARAQLASLQGRAHDLITAVCVIHPGQIERHCNVTRLVMRRLTDDALARYVAADEPYDCAGSYKIESRGIALFEQIETTDPTAIEGLPLMALTRIVRDLGFTIP